MGFRPLAGSGRRIRTLTYGVRVRCATFTQSRCVLANKNYYTCFPAFVNSFFARLFKVLFPQPLAQALPQLHRTEFQHIALLPGDELHVRFIHAGLHCHVL